MRNESWAVEEVYYEHQHPDSSYVAAEATGRG